MGGGGAMRAAAKVAGIGFGLRGAPSVSPAEHPVSSAARRATRPVPAIVSSPDEVNCNALTASQNSPIDASVQRPGWELDDWEFAGGDEELISKSGDHFPRLVFGGVPTFEEAKEATFELKDALDKVYLSSPLAKPEHPETKACVTSEEDIAIPVPKNAIKAFRLLNENPVARSVVASIASDPNVWHAVLQNEVLAEFLESHKSAASFSDMDPVLKESVADTKYVDHQSPKGIDDSSDSGKPADSGNVVMGFLQGIKTAVVDMMSSLSGYFQNLFGGPTAEKESEDTDGSAKSTFLDSTLAASFMGLAVMVIMVVMLKRV